MSLSWVRSWADWARRTLAVQGEYPTYALQSRSVAIALIEDSGLITNVFIISNRSVEEISQCRRSFISVKIHGFISAPDRSWYRRWYMGSPCWIVVWIDYFNRSRGVKEVSNEIMEVDSGWGSVINLCRLHAIQFDASTSPNLRTSIRTIILNHLHFAERRYYLKPEPEWMDMNQKIENKCMQRSKWRREEEPIIIGVYQT